MKLESGESAAPPKPRHTPSPWEAVCDADGDHAIWANDVLIAVTDGWPDATARVHSQKVRTHDEDEANAHLIAAAPELLAELEHAHDMIKHYLKAGYLPHMSAEEAEQLVRNPDSAILRAREGR